MNHVSKGLVLFFGGQTLFWTLIDPVTLALGDRAIYDAL